MDGRTYREQTQYDGYGRAWKTRDASGGWLKQQFDFGHGFVSAGVTAAASPYVSSKGDVFGTVASAIIGGRVSEMTGGKFANGARSGAFSYAFSSAMERRAYAARDPSGADRDIANPKLAKAAIADATAALQETGLFEKIYSMDNLRLGIAQWSNVVEPISIKYGV